MESGNAKITTVGVTEAHADNVTETDWLVVCKYCGRTFENMESLKVHKQNIHATGDVKPLLVTQKLARPKIKVEISSDIHEKPTAAETLKGNPVDMGGVDTWYKCSTCQEHVKDPIKFLLHQQNHHKTIPQLFHTLSGAILEIHQLPNRFEIFTPKIELKPIDEICRSSRVDTNSRLEIQLPKLTESKMQEVVAKAFKRRLRTRTKKVHNVVADEDEVGNDDSKIDSDWNGSEESDSGMNLSRRKSSTKKQSKSTTKKAYCPRDPKPLKWKDEDDPKGLSYTCTLCPAPWSYHNLGLYAIHMKNFHRKEDGKYNCTSCEYTNDNPHKFHEHMQGHEPEVPKRVIVCRICSDKTSFDSNFLYTKHMMDNHYVDGNFNCPYCPRIKLYKLYRYEKHMQKHDAMNTTEDIYQRNPACRKRNRPDDDPVCTLCGKSFQWKSALDEHMEAHKRMSAKLALKPHKCTVCPAAYYSKTNLTRHSYTHLDGDSLVCKFPDCGSRLSSKFHLERHMQRHFMATLACPICYAQCASRTTLDRHIKNYHKSSGEANLPRPRGAEVRCRVIRAVKGVKVPADLARKYSTPRGAPLDAETVQSGLSNLASSSSCSSAIKCEQEEKDGEDGRLELDSVHLGDNEAIKKECEEAMMDVNEELDALGSSEDVNSEGLNSIPDDPVVVDLDDRRGPAQLRRRILQSSPLLKRLAPEFVKQVKEMGFHYSTGGDPESYTCNLCFPPRSYQRAYFLSRHKLKEHPEEVAKETSETSKSGVLSLSCGACGLECENSDELTKHMNSAHGGEHRKFHCTTCGIKFKSQLNMEKHVKLIHTMELNFECDVCLKKYASARHLMCHKKRVHSIESTDPKNLTCKQCGKKMSYTWALRVHMKLHAKDRKLSYCKICGDKFSCAVSLRRHISLVHLKEKERIAEAKKICNATPESDLFL